MDRNQANDNKNQFTNGYHNDNRKSFGSDHFRNARSSSSPVDDICPGLIAFIKKHLLVVLIVTGAAIGFIIGLSINKAVQELDQPARYNVIILIGFPGELLLRMLKMLILPLITFSLILGISGLQGNISGKIGLRGIVYYMSTTFIAAIIGLIMVSAIRPGSGMSKPDKIEEQKIVRPLDSFLDIVRNMFPSNIVKACVEQDKTTIVIKNGSLIGERKVPVDVKKLPDVTIVQMVQTKMIFEEGSFENTVPLNQRSYYRKEKEYRTYKVGKGLETTGKANFLGLIVFAIAVGKIAAGLGSEATAFLNFVEAFNKIVTRLIVIVMWYSPVGICSLIMARCAEMEDIGKNFSGLGKFIATVVVSIAIHGLIVLPALFYAITRINPYKYLKGVGTAMATAFGTDSSAATLPVTVQCLEHNLKLDKRITRFIVPVGTTINMDGTALYEAVSAIFIAQAAGRSLSAGDYVAISFTSILASVGAAAIPHAGLVTMLIVLDTVGLPTDMIAIIFSVDWFLDRVRTMINVLGDAYGAGIVQHLSREDLRKADLLEGSNHQNEQPSSKSPLIDNKRHPTYEEEKEERQYDPRASTYC